ncbi:hypothetical protein BKA69DRAFT_1078597, partial [Paraphysoderma sedebokerense]
MTKPRRKLRQAQANISDLPPDQTIHKTLKKSKPKSKQGSNSQDLPRNFRLALKAKEIVEARAQKKKNTKGSHNDGIESASLKADVNEGTSGKTSNIDSLVGKKRKLAKLRERQKMKKLKATKKSALSDSEDDGSSQKRSKAKFKDFSELNDSVKFGEVVQAPPSLKVSSKMRKLKEKVLYLYKLSKIPL